MDSTFQDHRPTEIDKWLEVFSIFIHDIESPLASIKYLLQLIEQGKFDKSKPLHQRMVVSSRIALERAESIIYDIMAVAKSGSNGLQVHNVVMDVIPRIRESVNLAENSAAERNLKLAIDGDLKASAMALADGALLPRVLDNLIYNAMRHTPEGGEVRVSLECEQDSMFIHIKDSGTGLGDINPAVLFEKYGQVKLRREGKHRGVGLGLFFCKLAVTGMGGTIFAADHPDGGAVFSIRLKKAKE